MILRMEGLRSVIQESNALRSPCVPWLTEMRQALPAQSCCRRGNELPMTAAVRASGLLAAWRRSAMRRTADRAGGGAAGGRAVQSGIGARIR